MTSEHADDSGRLGGKLIIALILIPVVGLTVGLWFVYSRVGSDNGGPAPAPIAAGTTTTNTTSSQPPPSRPAPAIPVTATSPMPKVTVNVVQGNELNIRGLGADEAIDPGSTLHHEWVTINQENLPVTIPVDAGIQTSYELRHGYYVFQKLGVTCKEPVQALEIRTLVFDVWGRHLTTLVAEVISDLPPGPNNLGEFNSYYWSRADVAACYASISFVARVRTKAGRILVADPRPVLEQAARYNTAAKLLPADLEGRPMRPTTGPSPFLEWRGP